MWIWGSGVQFPSATPTFSQGRDRPGNPGIPRLSWARARPAPRRGYPAVAPPAGIARSKKHAAKVIMPIVMRTVRGRMSLTTPPVRVAATPETWQREGSAHRDGGHNRRDLSGAAQAKESPAATGGAVGCRAVGPSGSGGRSTGGSIPCRGRPRRPQPGVSRTPGPRSSGSKGPWWGSKGATPL